MPPKKRDKDTETTKNPRMDQIQADHELFLQAFENSIELIVNAFEHDISGMKSENGNASANHTQLEGI
ncbi:Protein of unknown function [Gryllus bimaculatus]|nr:Protein of unknown function [Gryllus bimaculatus]